MKSKIQILFLLTAIFSLVLSLTLVNAASFTLSTSTPNDLSKSKNQTSFLITPTIPTGQAITISVTLPQQISDGTNIITLNPPYTASFSNVLNGQTQGPVVVSYTPGTIPSTFDIGRFTVNANITATSTTNSSDTLSQTVPISFVSDFCNNGENGTALSISRVDVRNNDGDDTEWKPLDSISIKVEASNDGSNSISIREVYVELGLIDSNVKNVINKMDNLDDKKLSLGTISDGKSKTKTFTFNVPFDFDEGSYKLVVKAYSEDKGGQKALCTAHSSDLDNNNYQSISGVRETDGNKQVIITNIILSPETAQCSDKVQLSGEVANIGDTDYSDKIKVTLFNKDLKLNENIEIETDLEQGDSSSFTFDFDIPQDAAEKTYNLEMKTYYDYDTNDNTYGFNSDRTFTVPLKVQGNCKPITPLPSKEPSITAELGSETPEAIAGKEVILAAKIKNNRDSSATYTLSASGYSDWSQLISIEPRTLTVAPGASRDFSVVLSLNEDAEGDKDFQIKAAYDDTSASRTILVPVTKPTAAVSPILQHLRDNWFIYVIVVINIILIIAIIIVIARMTRKPKQKM